MISDRSIYSLMVAYYFLDLEIVDILDKFLGSQTLYKWYLSKVLYAVQFAVIFKSYVKY